MAEDPIYQRYREWVVAALRSSGLTQEAMADIAGVGRTSFNKGLKAGGRRFQIAELERISRETGIPLPAGISRPQTPEPFEIENDEAPAAGLGSGLPIRHMNAAGDGGYAMGEDLSATDLLTKLATTEGAFSFFIQNNQLAPRLLKGDRATVHPSQPPAEGDPVVVVLKGRANRRRAHIGYLVSDDENSPNLALRHNQPERVFEVPRAAVERVYRIAVIQLR